MLNILNRLSPLFDEDFAKFKYELETCVKGSKFLIIGGGGTIGRSTVRQIFKFKPKKIVLVDISENYLVETVRELRSTIENTSTLLQTFAIDVGSLEFDILCNNETDFDYVLNFSALKHVRSESNPYSISRMIDVNIFNAIKLSKLSHDWKSKNYFCVSTDKATNPENMMGASKRIMELFLLQESVNQNISFARFANVAFSEGSLLFGFNKRIESRHPLSAPIDVKRFFVTLDEAGLLCLFSCILGKNREIFFPKLNIEEHGTTFKDIAVKYLALKGYEAVSFPSAEEARKNIGIIDQKKWPCYFFESDTTGEKSAEEFYTKNDTVDFNKFFDIGVISSKFINLDAELTEFRNSVQSWRKNECWEKQMIVEIFREVLPDFRHEEKNKFLDEKM